MFSNGSRMFQAYVVQKNMSTETELNLKQRWCHRGPTARGLAPHLRNSCYEDAAWKAVVQSQGRLEVPKAGKDGIAFWCLDVCVCRCNVSNIFFCISLFSIFIYILYNPMTMLCFTPLFFDRCKVSIHLTGLKRIQRFAVAIWHAIQKFLSKFHCFTARTLAPRETRLVTSRLSENIRRQHQLTVTISINDQLPPRKQNVHVCFIGL